MANIFVISDTHFGHANIIGYSNRPFGSAEEMDEAMVDNWNTTIRPQDHVYHLGDVAIKRAHLAIVRRLNGKKRVVLGNHDIYDVQEYLKAGFQKVCAVRVLDNMALTHIPIHPGSLGRFRGNIHGHTHERGSPEGLYISACVEMIDYTPVSLEEMKKRAGW